MVVCTGTSESSPQTSASKPYESVQDSNFIVFSDEETTFATAATSPPKRRAGRKKFRETRHPVYRGVRSRNGDKWVCEVREPNKKSRIWLGTFPIPEMAARAHDVAAMALRGRKACLNFADSAWLLPIPASGSAKDIQKAASEAAEAFRPAHDPESGSVMYSSQDVGPDHHSSATTSVLVLAQDHHALLWMDEEVNFGMGMPGLLASMAEGLLLSPPPHQYSSSGFHFDDDVEEYSFDMSLWSHSMPMGH